MKARKIKKSVSHELKSWIKQFLLNNSVIIFVCIVLQAINNAKVNVRMVEGAKNAAIIIKMRRGAKVIYFTNKFASIPSPRRAGETFAAEASFRVIRGNPPASVSSKARLILGRVGNVNQTEAEHEAQPSSCVASGRRVCKWHDAARQIRSRYQRDRRESSIGASAERENLLRVDHRSRSPLERTRSPDRAKRGSWTWSGRNANPPPISLSRTRSRENVPREIAAHNSHASPRDRISICLFVIPSL